MRHGRDIKSLGAKRRVKAEKIMLNTAFYTAAAMGLGAAAWRSWSAVRARGLDRWVPAAIASPPRLPTFDDRDEPLEVFLAICDHYEPEWGAADPAAALERVRQWRDAYSRLFDEFRDVDG